LTNTTKTKTAFALAGLGGFDAHGAGFLSAASKCGIVPDMVTASSGQIIVLAEWLQGKDLEASLVDPELAHNPMAQLSILFTGYPGVFRPAYLETLGRWATFPSPKEKPLETLFNRLLPAQVYVPTRSAATFSTMADVFNSGAKLNNQEIGIVFNAYDLQTGQAGRACRRMQLICSSTRWCRMRPMARCCASRAARCTPVSPKS
jgi:hypothetical protein